MMNSKDWIIFMMYFSWGINQVRFVGDKLLSERSALSKIKSFYAAKEYFVTNTRVTS